MLIQAVSRLWRPVTLAFDARQIMTVLQKIADLKSLGPKSQEMLARAGITTVAELRKLGSVRAYVLAKRANENVSLNLLWALESALTGEPWQDVARKHRTSLLLALEEHEKCA